MLRKAKRVGCKALRYQLRFQLLDVRGDSNPFDGKTVVIEIGKRRPDRVDLQSRLITTAVTLYESPNGTFLPKPVVIKLKADFDGKALAEFTVDVAALASSRRSSKAYELANLQTMVLTPNPRSSSSSSSTGSGSAKVAIKVKLGMVAWTEALAGGGTGSGVDGSFGDDEDVDDDDASVQSRKEENPLDKPENRIASNGGGDNGVGSGEGDARKVDSAPSPSSSAPTLPPSSVVDELRLELEQVKAAAAAEREESQREIGRLKQQVQDLLRSQRRAEAAGSSSHRDGSAGARVNAATSSSSSSNSAGGKSGRSGKGGAPAPAPAAAAAALPLLCFQVHAGGGGGGGGPLTEGGSSPPATSSSRDAARPLTDDLEVDGERWGVSVCSSVDGGESSGGISVSSLGASSSASVGMVEAAAVLELSKSAEEASRLPPQALVGQWVTVEGLGLGKVLAFHKEWTPGTNSLHSIEFGGRWGGRGGGRQESVVEKVLLRRPKLRNVLNGGRMNGGLLFALSHPPPPLQRVDDDEDDDRYDVDEGDSPREEKGDGEGGDGKIGDGVGGGGKSRGKLNTGKSKEAAAAAAAAAGDNTDGDDEEEEKESGRFPELLVPGSSGPEEGEDDGRHRVTAERFRARSLARIQAGLPRGWVAALDPATQRPFFVSELDPSVSQWDPPTEPAESAPPTAAGSPSTPKPPIEEREF